MKRICGFSMWKRLPDESTFSRAFAEFAADGLRERAHAALVKATLGERLIGHISRDGTAIESREKPKRKASTPEVSIATEATPKHKRGRSKKGESCEIKLSNNAARHASNSWQHYRATVTSVPSVMHRATRTVGTATSYTSTQRTAAFR